MILIHRPEFTDRDDEEYKINLENPEWHLEALKRDFIRTQFIGTADINYITARWSFRNKFWLEYIWAASQAIEKYQKAILLYNSKPAKTGYDLSKAHKILLEQYSDLLHQGEFFPKVLEKLDENGITGITKRYSDTSEFIRKLESAGGPSVRYFSHSFNVFYSDLFYLDELIFRLRRMCCNLKHKEKRHEGLTNMEYLLANPDVCPDRYNKIEDIILKKACNDHLRDFLFNFNFRFSPDNYTHTDYPCFGLSAANSSLSLFDSYINSDNTYKNEIGKQLLIWMQDNIQNDRDTANYIKQTLG